MKFFTQIGLMFILIGCLTACTPDTSDSAAQKTSQKDCTEVKVVSTPTEENHVSPAFPIKIKVSINPLEYVFKLL